MAKAKPNPDNGSKPGKADKAGRKTAPLTAKVDLVRMIGIITQHKQVDIYEYIDPHLRPIVMADYAKAIREMGDELDGTT